jgi:CRISPR-associated protein Cas2
MEDHGERLQYSVFLCDLSLAELVELEARVIAAMDLSLDSVVQLDLGAVSSCRPVRWFGKRRLLPSSGGPQIV